MSDLVSCHEFESLNVKKKTQDFLAKTLPGHLLPLSEVGIDPHTSEA